MTKLAISKITTRNFGRETEARVICTDGRRFRITIPNSERVLCEGIIVVREDGSRQVKLDNGPVKSAVVGAYFDSVTANARAAKEADRTNWAARRADALLEHGFGRVKKVA